jgi:hypothetical protein
VSLRGAKGDEAISVELRDCRASLSMTRRQRQEFQGHHANQAYYESGIISPEYGCHHPDELHEALLAEGWT